MTTPNVTAPINNGAYPVRPGFPYPPGTVKAPLTPTQKTAILAYMKPAWALSAGGTGPAGGLTSPTFPQFMGYSDQSIINQYEAMIIGSDNPGGDTGIAVPGVGPLPTFGLGNLLAALGNPNTWIRVAEFSVGGILLAIGVNALLKGNPAYDAAKSTAGTVAKVIPK